MASSLARRWRSSSLTTGTPLEARKPSSMRSLSPATERLAAASICSALAGLPEAVRATRDFFEGALTDFAAGAFAGLLGERLDAMRGEVYVDG